MKFRPLCLSFLLGAIAGAGGVWISSARYQISEGKVGTVSMWLKTDRLTGKTWQYFPSGEAWQPIAEK
jgi:hypothetical protein